MQFVDRLGTCFLVQTVDILCNNCLQFAKLFQFGQCFMRCVRLCICADDSRLVKILKCLRSAHKERMRKDGLRRTAVLVHGIVDAVFAPEIGDPALGGYTRAAEKYNVI